MAGIPEQLVRTSVSSTNVRAVAYDSAFRRLYVEFNSGAVYAYDDVPFDLYSAFLAASSKGSFVHRRVRGWGRDNLFSYRRVQ